VNVFSRLGHEVARRWGRVAATGDAGSSTVEMALVTPFLVMLLLLVVLCGRLAGEQMAVDAAAGSAARAASIARSHPAARADGDRTARDTLAAQGVTCDTESVTVDTGGLHPGGAVTVTVSCQVKLSDLLLIGVPGSRTVQASSTSPIDHWRGAAP
jgi:Flp pilus assembly protein TadG